MPGQLKVAWLKLNAATTEYQHSSHNLDHLEGLEIYYYDVNVCKAKLDYHYGKIYVKFLRAVKIFKGFGAFLEAMFDTILDFQLFDY